MACGFEIDADPPSRKLTAIRGNSEPRFLQLKECSGRYRGSFRRWLATSNAVGQPWCSLPYATRNSGQLSGSTKTCNSHLQRHAALFPVSVPFCCPEDEDCTGIFLRELCAKGTSIFSTPLLKLAFACSGLA